MHSGMGHGSERCGGGGGGGETGYQVPFFLHTRDPSFPRRRANRSWSNEDGTVTLSLDEGPSPTDTGAPPVPWCPRSSPG